MHERIHRGFGFTLLNKSHYCVDNNNDENNKYVGKITQSGFSARFNNCNSRLNCGGDKKHNNHGIGKRIDKLFEQAVLFDFFQLVFPVLLKTLLSFGRRKTVRRAFYVGKNLVGAFEIELHRSVNSFLFVWSKKTFDANKCSQKPGTHGENVF